MSDPKEHRKEYDVNTYENKEKFAIQVIKDIIKLYPKKIGATKKTLMDMMQYN